MEFVTLTLDFTQHQVTPFYSEMGKNIYIYDNEEIFLPTHQHFHPTAAVLKQILNLLNDQYMLHTSLFSPDTAVSKF